MPPPRSPQIPIDPALSLYPPYYQYPQQTQHMGQHLNVPQNLSSPSSQGSDTIGTPPTEHMSYTSSNANGKRPSSNLVSNPGDSSRKKSRTDEGTEGASPSTEAGDSKPKTTRGSRACTVCRRLKMKCVGAEQGPPCKRCIAGNHECIFEESNRGKRSTKKHELLTRSLKKMERTLDTVLRSIGNPSIASGMVSRSPSPSGQTAQTQALLDSPSPPPQPGFQAQSSALVSGSPKLHALPDNALNPLGLLAEASLANRRAQGTSSAFSARPSDPDPDRRLGIASDNYFRPGPMTILPLRRLYIERQIQPEMLSFVSTEEVVALFNIYFEHMNIHCDLFDRDFHTPALVCSRSPFLLTTICAIASKFYTVRPDLHAQLAELAQKLAFSVPAKGYKSLEIVQAYLLLTLWGCGAVERYEYDKTWLLLGMAIRMATDLNLHRKTAVTSQDSAEGRARDKEVHNRERTWFLCFALDRSASAQMGKPHSIKEDFVIRNALVWIRSPVGMPGDISLAAYVELQRIVSRSLEFLYSGTNTPSGLQTDCDYLVVIKTIETQILAWEHEWTTVRRLPASEDVLLSYSGIMMKFYFHYYMLVINSFGLQNAMERSAVDIGHFFARCHTSATAVATMARDELAPRGYLKYSPDSHFVFISYAVLSLLKLIRPEFQTFLENEQKVFDLVKDVANVMESVAVNSHHTPALYSSFLRALISARTDAPVGHTEPEEVSAGEHEEIASHTDLGYANSTLFGGPMGNGMNGMSDYQGEMPPTMDITKFPPTMTSNPEESMGMMSMDLFNSGFWDSVLVPGYSDTIEGLSGGFVYGAGGSGLITPGGGWMQSPLQSGSNTPLRADHNVMDYGHQNMAYQQQRMKA
ncbi:fungal-specific transcription factor domain-containing protein [Hygrophoropsis aurantiaca]|uniref:Fungal-specific transcription factor domain-containing protein n=1 Tax=Hygrophoropsis aurantiaca TaxID=72124 RepID=A0ACB8AL59_9AGAM|nr:fungal-specific transcription factor domain-containing protein [Hygrophoropsis aurantiaca]